MLKYLLLLLMLLLSTKAFAQTSDSLKVFESLSEALERPQEVFILDLSEQNLREVPQDIGKLSQLKTLYLSYNQLSEVPDFWDKLPQLERLYLHNNQLKTLPASFTNLQKLKVLELGNNRFRVIPDLLLNLPNLEELYVYGNRIRKMPDKLPVKLKKLRVGKGFYTLFGGNRIAQLPDNFGDNQNLESLTMPDNRLRKLPPSFENLQRLKYLDLSQNRFKKIPPSLYKLDSLKALMLWNRGFSYEERSALAEALPRTQIHYDHDYEGAFWVLLLGFQQGRSSLVELGISRAYKLDFFLLNIAASAEIDLNHNLQGYKLSAAANGGMSVGIAAIYYQEKGRGFPALRPELGIGLTWWSLRYGYNVIFRSGSEHINQHLVSLRLHLPFSPSLPLFR